VGIGLERVRVVVPVFNEAPVIAGVVRDLLAVFPQVICVDDGSIDGSGTAARTAGARVVTHPINLGQGAALETGIRLALSDPETDCVVTFDADDQHDVDDALAMVERMRSESLDVVLGSRFLGQAVHMPWRRRLLLIAAVRLTRRTSGLTVTDTHNGLRALSRRAASVVQLRLHGMSHASEILTVLARGGFDVVEHPVTIRYTEYSRAKGQRSYNALNVLFELAVNRLRAVA
jgi:glycosyltransferase involved in cell wall biosynthesis